MKRRILVLCLSLALVFMAIAVPADAIGIELIKNAVEDPPNRFCVGNTIHYILNVTNPSDSKKNMTLDVYDTYPNGATEQLEDDHYFAIGDKKTYSRSYVVEAGDVGKWITNRLWVNGTDETGAPVFASMDMYSRILDPRISITKVASPTSGALGTDVNFTITVTNTGDCTLDSVEVVDTLPVGMSFVSADSGGSESSPGSGTIIWDLGTMVSGATHAPIHLVAHIDVGAAGPLTNNVLATGTPENSMCDDVTDIDDAVVTVTYSIAGMKFNDLNGNGVKDAGEPGLPGWTINLEQPAGTVINSTTTAADGSYSFTHLAPGTYTVSEVLKAGWAQTCPPTPGTYSVTLTDSPVIDRDFGNRGALSISGMKFNDLNGDGVKDPGEPGLPDWTINLAGPVSGTTTTAADGSYSFTNLEPGDYTVSEVLKAGWAQTCPPTPGTYSVTLTDSPVIDRDFGNRGALSISGMKFNDLNGDGVKDPGEPGLPDWTINLAGPVSGTTTTAADGSYSFTNLEPGDYTVSEVLKAGWAQTCPPTPGTYSVTLTDSPVIDRDFGNRGALSISGMKFNDLNGDGVKDPGEPGLPDWTINLAGPVSGTTTTAADGSYSFTNLEPGDYTVSEVLKAGWAQTCPPTPGTYSVTLTDSPVIDRDFGNRGALSISGMKFNDLNGDGVKDPGEPGLPDWTINLAGPVSGTTTTAADGSYSFTNLEPGDYTVSEVLKAGWAQTCPPTPGTYSVTLTDSPVIDRDFGNRGALSISGMKFNDLNGDGVKDPGEPGLPDWTINLAGPVSGTTTTAADGSYSFTNLEPGDYTVSEVLKAGWAQTCPPTPGTYSVILTDSPVIDRDFGNRGALSISGMKFNDLNGDGVKDPGEPGLPDWTINLAGPVSGTTTTAADGSYSFTNLEPGDYTVSEVLKAGWAQTCPPTPGTYSVTLTDSPVIDRDFGNRGALSISGMKFNDLNGDGVKDPGEPGLPDWTINLAGPVSGTTTTAADGSYSFTNLEPGDYTVSEVLKAGWAQTCPPTPGTYSVTLTDSPVIDRDFGNRGALSISGMKFNDLNGDGVKDPGEPGLPDWTINLAGPVSGTTTTAADGSYSFTNLEPGDYTVSEVLKAGWAQTCPPTPGTYSVTLTDSPVIDRDFGNRGALSISGMKFNDLNGDGVKDPGEPGLPDWTINLAGPVSGTTTTAADGSYSFTNLEPGDYTVSEVLKAGWAQTCPPTPGTYSVTLTDSPVIDRDFGNRGALSISGMKFNDLNGDGVKDAGEPGLPDWTINLAGPVSGTTTTAADGSYSFTNLEPGDYTVSEVLKAGWAQTCPPTPGTYSVILTDSPVIDRDFGNRGALSISGMKFNDLNGDGVKDPGEPGLPDWTINLAGPVSGTTTTAADGSYSFTNLEPGDYTVSEVLKAGWVQTCPPTPGTYSVTLTDSPVIDRDFGNRGALSISGMKFNDLNGDGVKDPGEPGLPDWTINLAGPVSGTTTTAADGSYSFTNLEPGDYTVSEVLKAGWVQTCPPTPGTYSVTLTDSPVIDRDFGNRGALSISGMKFNDLNGDGVKDPGEPGLPDWTINLAGPVSGTTTTAADGSYSFTNLEPGDYTVSEVLKAGWAQTCPPTPGTYSVTLTDSPVIDRDFGNRGAMSISGMKFNDLNGNGVKDAGEPGLPDWTINLAGPVSGTTTTAADGSYSFTNLKPGDYTVSEVLKAGWVQTCPPTPGTYSVTLTDSPVIDRDFGNRGALSISGMKFNDLNGDGVKDPGEPGLPDWTINLAGPVSGTTTTAADGSYSFTNLEPGDYTVSEVLKAGWAQTCPPTPGTYSVTLTDSPVIDRDFGNRGALSISGMKFNDLNGDGVKDPGEPGLSGWTINLAGPVSGTTTTAADGSYSFTNLEPGDYTVSEVLKAGWAQTCPPTPGTYSVSLTDTSATDKDFGNRGAMSISGMKFNDLNGNGVKDAGEPGLPDWTINLAGPVSGTTTTAADGSYSFTNLKPGDYTVSEVLKAGWVQTCPTPPGTYSVSLIDTSATDKDFGNGAPSIEVVKTASLTGTCPGSDPLAVSIGDTVTYCFNVTNTGDVNLTGVTVNDNVYGSVTLATTSLAPGETTGGTITHVVVEANAPSVTNTATATGTDPLGGTVTDTDPCTINVAIAPDIEVIKTASLTGTCPGSDPLAVSIGDTVTYCFNVTNTGDVNLTGVTVNDNVYGSVTLATTSLAPGETTGGTVTHVVVESDAPSVTNTATATGTDPFGGTVTDTDDCTIEVTIGPGIEVVKTASLTGTCPGSDPLAVSIGDTVTYCFNVTNTGDVNLTGITVVDDIYGPVTLATTTLAPGESTGGTLTHVVVESDAPSVTNTATATGTDPFGGTVTDTDDCTIKAMIDPEIYVNKTAHPTEGTVGTDITFTINVTNTGDCTLNPVKVIDELQPGLSYVSSDPPADTHNGILIWNNVGPLVPGQSTTITVVALIDTEAVGVLNNTVTATGTDPLGGLVTDNDTAQVAVISVGLEKSGSPAIVAPSGTVTYTINYTNTGAVPLHNVVITENYPNGVTFISASPAPDAGTNNVWTIGTLLPGESGTIVIKVKVPESIDLSFTETGSVIGEGVVMVTKDLSTEQKPYSLRNSVTLSCAELDPVSRYATTKVSGVPGTSLGITESGSGVYSSDEILDLETKNKSIILKKTTHAEYKPTSFDFSDSFSINFTNKWKQDICSRNMEIGAAIHKKISDATYIDDETISRVDENKSVMNFDSSFNGSMYIGARTKDTAISETYIGEFDVLQTIQIGKGPIPTPLPTPTPTPTWLPCPFNDSQEMNITEEAEPTHDAKIKIEKSANRTSATVGDVIRYSYVVTNIGNINLTGVTVTDSNLGLVGLNRTELEPTEVANGTLLYTVNQSDVCANITNTADVTATDGCGDPVTNTSNQVIVTTDS